MAKTIAQVAGEFPRNEQEQIRAALITLHATGFWQRLIESQRADILQRWGSNEATLAGEIKQINDQTRVYETLDRVGKEYGQPTLV